jgi:O-antigen/teichoic acid export membrane protein
MTRGERVRGSHTVRAAGVASAQMAANVLALVTTVALARALGTADYGELARMVSVFTILIVPATALQAAAARDMTLGRLGPASHAIAGLQGWVLRILLITAGVLAACVLLRYQLADLLQVSQPWAAAIVIPSGFLWTALALQRGVLLGVGGYRPVAASLVGEQAFRLLFGLAAAFLGAEVGLIFFCSVPLATIPIILMTGIMTRRRLGPSDHKPVRVGLRDLASRNPVPVAALTLFAVLQNADVIAVGHFFDTTISGAYAQAAVAAKGIVWIAIGLGLYLLPEAAREVSKGDDARHLLTRTGGLLMLVAIPILAIFSFFPEEILTLVFGDQAKLAAPALPWLAAAMTCLSISYLALQFLLALGRRFFLAVLTIGAVAVPAVVAIRDTSLESVAIGLLVLDAILALTMLAISFSSRTAGEHSFAEGDAEAFALAEASAAAEAAIP